MNCLYCGKEFTPEKRAGRPRKYCSDDCCYNADRDNKRIKYVGKRESVCVRCGKPLPKYKTRFCSDECRRGSREHTKVCIVCGKEFVTTRSRTLTCSEECSKANERENDNRTYRQRYKKKNPDARTMEQVLADSAKRKERIAKERKERAEAKEAERKKILAKKEKIKAANIAYWQEYNAFHVCAVCGEVYTAHHPFSKYCSSKCARKLYKKRDRYNGITVDADITLEALARRDNNTCQICGGAVDWDDKKTINGTVICGNNYPSIDHIMPISKGGLHSWDNVQLAHRYCNTLKCDKVI